MKEPGTMHNDLLKHGLRVAQLFQEVHIELTGKPPSAEMIFGATMHDIGKLLIPDSVLYRDGELSSAEWVLMHQHPMQGAEILERYGLPPAVCEVVRYHHEALDGSGYYGKFSDEIPFEAKIIRACDTYDAMTAVDHTAGSCRKMKPSGA
jgi:putative nucleotidyltransferase with HDIG domain